MHAFITPVFVYVLARWIAYELRPKKFNIWRRWAWIAAAVAIQLWAVIISLIIEGKVGNLVLHGVGGGVATTLIFFYLIRTFEIKMIWRVELAALFVFVSTLGVLNELAEYLGELTTSLVFSHDIHDTWRDFVANSTGAIMTWLIIKPILSRPSTGKKQG